MKAFLTSNPRASNTSSSMADKSWIRRLISVQRPVNWSWEKERRHREGERDHGDRSGMCFSGSLRSNCGCRHEEDDDRWGTGKKNSIVCRHRKRGWRKERPSAALRDKNTTDRWWTRGVFYLGCFYTFRYNIFFLNYSQFILIFHT